MLVYLRVFRESFSFALNALRNNKLRTFLSLLGVTVGIFSIIAVLAAVDSLDRNIRENLEGIDSNTTYVTHFSFGPTDVPKWKRDNFGPMQYEDYKFISRNVPGIEAAAYGWFGAQETIRYEGETVSNVDVNLSTYGIYDISNLDIELGRFYSEVESVSGSPVIVLGYKISEGLFGKSNPIGKQVRIYGRKLTVIGVLEKVGASTIGDSPDEQVFIPVNFVRKFKSTKRRGQFLAVILKPKSGIDMGAFESQLKQKFRVYRGLKVDEDDDFFISRFSGFVTVIESLIGSLNVIGWIISGFSLLVGGFGIANIMFVSVKERTNLIGIQKSLGAKNRFILFQFLFEAVILAVVGGLIGLVLVWIIAKIMNGVVGEDFKFVLSFGNMFLGFALSSFIGLLSGVIPAISASKLDPVEAIRTGM